MTTTYTKLKDGNWGVRVVSRTAWAPVAGDDVTVQKKDGTEKREEIAKVLWSGPDKADPSKTVYLCAIAQKPRSGGAATRTGARVTGGRRACVSGGNCSSFGSGRSCGGHDCDGF